MPGVLLLQRVLEAIEAIHGPLGVLRLPQVKFAQPLLPGERADIEFEQAASDVSAPRWRFRVLHGEVLLVSGEVCA